MRKLFFLIVVLLILLLFIINYVDIDRENSSSINNAIMAWELLVEKVETLIS